MNDKDTITLEAKSIDDIKFEISGNDFISGKYNKICWESKHRTPDDGSLTFHGIYKDDFLYLSIRKHGFIETIDAHNRIPKNILEGRKFLIYVTPYLGFHNVEYEELM